MKEKINVRKVYLKILSLLTIPFFVAGCAKKSECDIKDNHVHKYIANTEKGRIVTYLNSEELDHIKYDNNYPFSPCIHYNWTNDTIEVTQDDLEFYKLKGELFVGTDNLDYLNNLKNENKDYIEYHYDYSKRRVVTTSTGKITQTYPIMQRHEGYTDDHNHEGLDGKVKLYHYQYYGYKIEKQDGKYVKIKSPLVDDINEIIDEYPYFSLLCFEIEPKEYEFDKDVVSSIRIEDINSDNYIPQK